MSLRNKILLFSVVPVVVILILVVGIALSQMRNRLLEVARQEIRIEMATAAAVIDQGNHEAVTVPQVMAAAQANGLFGERQNSVQLAREILEENPQFIGAYFAYEPNADGQDRASLARLGAQHASLDESGRFIPYWFRSLVAGGRIVLEPLVEMDASLYYNGMKQKFLQGSKEPFIITEPYVYNKQNLIIEQTSAILIDGKFVGIAGVDRGLDFLDEFVRKLKPFETAELTVVSGRGAIVATTMGHLVGEDLRTIRIDDLYLRPDGHIVTDIFKEQDGKRVLDPAKADSARLASLRTDLGDLLRDFVRNAESDEVSVVDNPLTGGRVFAASAHIPTGNWTLGMTVSWDEITAPIRRTLWWVIITAFSGTAVVVGLLFYLANSISHRIQTVGSLARRVADGDLTASVEVETGDETGQLQRSITDMVQSLSTLIGKVKLSSIRVMSTATEISAGSRQQEAAINDFGSSTNQITAAAKQISATSQELLSTMNGVSEVAEETASLADAGHSGLGGMETTMNQLVDATGSISGRLATISDKAGNINSVVTTITKVADQTNLLSLNAAIEAEKAGEYGLGFAVVAREIRRLADQTAVATLDIEQMVKEMQSAVSAGVMEMDKFSDEVRRGVEEVGRVGSQLQEIIHRVQTLTERFGAVNEGMQSQSEGARQISDALLGLSEGVRQTADTLKDFNRASENLSGAVDELRQEVSRFRVEDQQAGATAEQARKVA